MKMFQSNCMTLLLGAVLLSCTGVVEATLNGDSGAVENTDGSSGDGLSGDGLSGDGSSGDGSSGDNTTAGDSATGGDTPPVVNTGIIFETNFDEDASFSHTGPTRFPWSNIGSIHPEGFDGTLIEGKGKIYGVDGEGMGTNNSNGGSVALKFEWADLTQPVTQLFKHLTGNARTGYEEVYVRYNVRLTNAITIGNASKDDLPYWKWGRLWQNTSSYPGGVGDPDSGAGNWGENRQNSYYVVWNFGGTATWGFYNKAVYGANDLNGVNLSGGSADSARYGVKFYDGSGSRKIYAGVKGAFGNVGNGAWEFDVSTRKLLNNTDQTYHTLEWRFKLASSQTAGDGVYQSWFDGVEQTPPVSISQGKLGAHSYDPPLDPSDIPTSNNSEVDASYNTGSGWNFFVLFDNLTAINKDWPITGDGNGIWVNDIVISTERIGDAYIAKPFTP